MLTDTRQRAANVSLTKRRTWFGRRGLYAAIKNASQAEFFMSRDNVAWSRRSRATVHVSHLSWLRPPPLHDVENGGLSPGFHIYTFK